MELVLRVAIVYVFLLFALRVIGKREFSELTAMELAVLLIVPELFQQAMIGDDSSLTGAIVAASTLLMLVFANSILTYLNPALERVVESTPTVLAHDGRLVEKNMRRERVTPDELYGALHQNGYERLDQVKWAILDTGGKIVVVPLEEAR